MTPQERAAAFIKSTFPLHLREDGEPCDGDIEDVVAHDKDTRRAALLECVQQLREGARLAQSREVANALSGHAYTIDRLAQER